MDKERGQVSIDLLISLLIMVLFIASMAYFVTDFKNTQENIILENQLKTIASNMTAFITSANALEGTTFSATMVIPDIIYKEKTIAPNVSINGNTITIDANGQSVSKEFTNNSDQNNLSVIVSNNSVVVNSV